ncbi:MAG: TIGR00730 family Rossman fold protein [Phycisphaerales bacterium]|nr:TIGR00730 family Rossman fold protein [Phycisphaerales bacterium]
MGEIKRITVFCGSSTRADAVFLEAAARLGTLIGERGLTLVFGGGSVGLMGAVYAAAKAAGAKTIGVTTKQFVELEQAVPDCDELVVKESIGDRKQILLDRGDAILVLPGGLGTYEEFFDAFVGRVLGHHTKAIALVDIDQALSPLVNMIEDGIHRKFISHGVRDYLHICQTPEDALDRVLMGTEHVVDPSRMVPSGDWDESDS